MSQAVNLGGFVGSMVERVKLNRGIATCAGVFRVTDPRSGNGNNDLLDRFTLAIPYGGLLLKWEVIFNYNYPEQPPDFIFLNDANTFHPDILQLKSLPTWDSKNDDALQNLLSELLDQYKEQQFQKLASSNSLGAELNELVEFIQEYNSQLTPDEDGEMHHFMQLEVFASRPEEHVRVMTRIPVTLHNLSRTQEKDNEKMLVLLSYARMDGGGNDPVCQLYPSPRLEKLLSSMGGLACSPPHKYSSMIDHVKYVSDKLSCMMEEMRQGVEKRKNYVQAVVSEFFSHVIEYDGSTFHNCSLLFSVNSSCILLTIEISRSFPTSQPPFTFTSMGVQERGDALVQRVVRDYPYSPRWTPLEMAGRMRKFLQGNLSSIENDLHTK